MGTKRKRTNVPYRDYACALKAADDEEAATKASTQPTKASVFAELLITEVLYGFMTASRARRFCEALGEDNIHHEDIDRIAALGKKGFHQSNIWRDLQKTYPLSYTHTKTQGCACQTRYNAHVNQSPPSPHAPDAHGRSTHA